MRISVAPMMDHTDRHFRAMVRVMSTRVVTYTEMVTTGAVLHGDREHLLGFSPAEHPVVLQLGGDDPSALAASARIAEDLGYDEINLNVGCPSDRVQAGRFGACLMARPEVVAEGVAAMRAVVKVPVTVKHRIGIDDLDSYEHMARFVEVVAEAGCRRFVVHARKAWLTGLSPKENRTVPPLRYGDVHRLQRDRPDLAIEINGGVRSLSEVREHEGKVEGVMIGRAFVEDPWLLVLVEHELLGAPGPVPTREEIALRLVPYADTLAAAGHPAHRLTRHMGGLFAGQPGARAWRRWLSEHGREAGGGVILGALAAARRPVPQEAA